MVKTHEKSKIYPVVGTGNTSNIKDVVLQMELTGQKSANYFVYLVETVSREEYDRTTAEGRAEAAEKRLQEETETHRAETEELKEQITALKDGLRESLLVREELKTTQNIIVKEYEKIRDALVECHRIYGELPPEIEALIGNGKEMPC